MFVNQPSGRREPGFSLLELLCAVAVVTALTVAGAWVAADSRSSHLLAADRLVLLLDQARSLARVRQVPVSVVMVAPDQSANAWRLALYQYDPKSAGPGSAWKAMPLGRWESLGAGVVLSDAVDDELCNPLACPERQLLDGRHPGRVITGHVICFNRLGRVVWPPGDRPLVLEVTDRGGTCADELWLGRGLSRARRIMP